MRPCQYVRGQGPMSAMRELGGAQIVCRRLSGLAIGNNVERDLLSLIEAVHAGAFDCADMHEDIFAAVLGSNESETFLAVKPLDCSLHHGSFPCVCVKIKPRANAAGSFEILGEGRQSGALIAARPIRSAENSMPAYIEHYCTVRKTQVTQTQVTQPQVTPIDLCELHSLESMNFLETRSLFSMARLYKGGYSATLRRHPATKDWLFAGACPMLGISSAIGPGADG
jgi:hypothetical protein